MNILHNLEAFDERLLAIVADRRCHRIVVETVTRMIKTGILTVKRPQLQNAHPIVGKIDELVDEFTQSDLERRVAFARVILRMAELDYNTSVKDLTAGLVHN